MHKASVRPVQPDKCELKREAIVLPTWVSMYTLILELRLDVLTIFFYDLRLKIYRVYFVSPDGFDEIEVIL